MAEIKIEKKKPIWPWILGVIVVIIALFFLFSNGDDIDTDDADNSEMVVTDAEDNDQDREWEEETPTSNGNIEEYVAYINDDAKMGIDHNYTNNAIMHLIDAVEEKAGQLNMDINADIDKAREEAKYITDDPQATNHAESIKKAGTTLTKALRNMQKEKFPDLSNEVDEIETAVSEIDPSVLTLDQKDDVKEFFDESADLIQKMNTNNNNI